MEGPRPEPPLMSIFLSVGRSACGQSTGAGTATTEIFVWEQGKGDKIGPTSDHLFGRKVGGTVRSKHTHMTHAHTHTHTLEPDVCPNLLFVGTEVVQFGFFYQDSALHTKFT